MKTKISKLFEDYREASGLNATASKRTRLASGMTIDPKENQNGAFTKDALKKANSRRAANLQRLDIELDTRPQFQQTPFKLVVGRWKASPEKQIKAHERANQTAKIERDQYEASEKKHIAQIFESDKIRFKSEIQATHATALSHANQWQRRNENSELAGIMSGKSDRQLLEAIGQRMGLTIEDFE